MANITYNEIGSLLPRELKEAEERAVHHLVDLGCALDAASQHRKLIDLCDEHFDPRKYLAALEAEANATTAYAYGLIERSCRVFDTTKAAEQIVRERS